MWTIEQGFAFVRSFIFNHHLVANFVVIIYPSVILLVDFIFYMSITNPLYI